MSENNKHLNQHDLSKLNQLSSKYFFEFNEALSSKTAEISPLVFRKISVIGGKILFCVVSKDKKSKEIIVTDRQYNLINAYDMSVLCPSEPSSFTNYKGNYLICGMTAEGDCFAKIFSMDFEFLGMLADGSPFFENRQILSAVDDGKGGTYFCEANTSTAHYLSADGVISSYIGDFKMPYHISYFNDSLYIADYFKTARLGVSNNISVFKDGVFNKTKLTGECIAYSPELGSFFVCSGFLENSVKKYDLNNNFVFIKNFDFSDKHHVPMLIAVNNNNLLISSRSSNSPVVYDIY